MLTKIWNWLFPTRVEHVPMRAAPLMDGRWERHDFYSPSKDERLAALATASNRLKIELARAKRQKKARRHLYAALQANTEERLKLEGEKV